MKRLWAVLLLIGFASFVYADRLENIIRIEGKILPAVSSSGVTIASAGVGLRNCLTDVTAISNSTYTFRILDGATNGTTTFQLLLPANVGLAKDWRPETPFCGSPNSAMLITVDNGTYSINYQGVVARP